MNRTIEDWLPIPPNMGPPLPKFLGILWPWYKEEEPPPPGAYACPYCPESFETLAELIEHARTAHPDNPPIEGIEISWE